MIKRQPWWRGARGEWYVVIQFALLGLLLAVPWLWPMPAWPAWLAAAGRIAGVLLGLVAAFFIGSGLWTLGRNLTAVPHPKEDAVLVMGGAYGLVRHPIYSGIVGGALGWGLLLNHLPTIGLGFLFFLFFDIKSRREEKWLVRKFPHYAAYQKHVPKLLPFIY